MKTNTATPTSNPQAKWAELNHRQKLAAFVMNQDNLEQSGLSMTDEWEEFKTCFDETEWAETWANLNRQANAFDMDTEHWKSCMAAFLACSNRKR